MLQYKEQLLYVCLYWRNCVQSTKVRWDCYLGWKAKNVGRNQWTRFKMFWAKLPAYTDWGRNFAAGHGSRVTGHHSNLKLYGCRLDCYHCVHRPETTVLMIMEPSFNSQATAYRARRPNSILHMNPSYTSSDCIRKPSEYSEYDDRKRVFRRLTKCCFFCCLLHAGFLLTVFLNI
jgi:hypothetical protein